MKIFDTLAVTLAMYSRIPAPKIPWTRENMKYSMCFLPIIGAIIGAVLIAFNAVSGALKLGDIVTAAGFTLIPVLITGGFHLDGFCDTADALASHASTEKKLEILHDSNSGAFAIIAAISYFLLYFAVCTEIEFTSSVLCVMVFMFMLTRELSGLAVCSFKCARNSGLLYTFADAAHKKRARFILLLVIAVTCAAMIAILPIIGGAMVLAAAVCFAYYRKTAYNKFGGITGDLAGYFLQICELTMLFAMLVVQKLI